MQVVGLKKSCQIKGQGVLLPKLALVWPKINYWSNFLLDGYPGI